MTLAWMDLAGLSLHSTQPGMVVTEVAAWCQVHAGDLQKLEVGDMLKAIDGWAVTRDVEAVKRRLLGACAYVRVCARAKRTRVA
jgi:hypothetical protein